MNWLFIFRVKQHSMFWYYSNIIIYFPCFFSSISCISFVQNQITRSYNKTYTRNSTEEKNVWNNKKCMKWGLLNIYRFFYFILCWRTFNIHKTFMAQSKMIKKRRPFFVLILITRIAWFAYIVLSLIFDIKTWITFYLDCLN